MGGVGVFPAEGLGGFGVRVDVAAELARQVSGGGEDATSDDVALQFGKPQLDLVEPRGIGGGKVEPHVGVSLEKRSHSIGLVSRKIIENDVNLLPRLAESNDLGEKVDEVLAGVPQGSLAVDFPGASVQGGVERERAVTLVLEAVPFGAAGRQRQDAIAAIECLHGGLFVDAEDGGMPRRIEVEAKDIGGLGLKVGIVGGHVALQAMRLEIGLAPDAVDQVFADAEMLSEFATRPVGGAVAGLAAGGVEDAGAQTGG